MTPNIDEEEYTKEDLEVQYTPSLFSKRFRSREELFKHFINFSKNGNQLIALY